MAKKYVQSRGCDNLVYALVTADTADEYTTGEVKDLAGVKSVATAREQSSETVYVDNIAGFTVNSAINTTRTFEVTNIDLEVLAEITGQFYEASSGMIVNTSNAIPPYIAVGYRVGDTDGSNKVVWAYKCKAQTPEENSATSDNGTESQGQTLTIECIQTLHQFTKTGKGAVDIAIPEVNDAYNMANFFKEVTTPDTLTAKTGA